MNAAFGEWLRQRKYKAKTITNHLACAARVERYHGDLDEHYAKDQMASLVEALRYSVYDAGHHRPNPSRIPFEGDIRTNLAAYRAAVKRYKEFRDAYQDGSD